MMYQFRRRKKTGEKRDAILAESNKPERITSNKLFQQKDRLEYFICQVDDNGQKIEGTEQSIQNFKQ